MRKIAKIFGWTLLSLLVVVLLVPALLYVPFVQDWAVGLATRKVGEATGMKVEVGRLRLGFPLRLKVDDVTVIQANADTMLTASRAAVTVRLMPLLRKQVDVERIELDTAFYQLGNRDSVLWLRAHLDRGVIDGADMNLTTNAIGLDRADIDGVRVRLRMLEDTTATPVDTAKSTPFLIKAGLIRMSDVRYSMEMLPVIDSLGCTVDMAVLRDATVDMANKRIFGQSLRIDSVGATYLYPAPGGESAPVRKEESEPTDDSEMWTITADTLRLTARDGLYAQRGVVPMAGFAPSYIAVNDVIIEVDSFYNRGTSIRVPLRRLDATERCGLPLHAEGLFVMDDEAMRATGFSVGTLRSVLRLDAMMGMGDITTDPSVPLMLKGSGRIDPSDVALAFPDMKAMTAPLKPASLSADIDGTSGQLNIYSLDVIMPGVVRMRANGTVDHPLDPAKAGADLSVDGSLAALSDRQFAFLPIKHIPALQLKGDVDYHPGEAQGSVEVTTSGGRIAADGSWTARTEDYDADVRLDRFPVDVFMPELGIGDVTGRVRVDGKGYNPMAAGTSIDADMKIADIEYNKERYEDIALDVALHAGEATGRLVSRNPGADASLDFTALLKGDTVRYDLTGDLRDINLQTLHLSDSLNNGHATIRSAGFYEIASGGMDVTAGVSNLYWRLPGMTLSPGSPVDLSLASGNADGTKATLTNGDLDMRFSSPSPLLSFIDSLTPAISEVMAEADSMRINVRRINDLMPRFALDARMGNGNVASEILASSGIRFSTFRGAMANDSLIKLGAEVLRLDASGTRLDTVRVNVIQHGDYLVYKATVNNRPGTFDDFAHVNINGFAGFNRASVFMSQRNINGERGFNVGVNAAIADSVVSVNIVPRKPVIAYKTWTLNDSNFISLNLADKHIDADLRISSGDSYIKIFTPAHAGDSLVAGHHSHAGGQEDIIVQAANVQLQDWLSINPFAPPVKGELSANLHFTYQEPVLTGKGTISLDDLYYGRDRVGSFGLDVNVENTPGGKLMADVGLMVDSVRTITAHGVLNDSTLASPFLLDFNMIQFPLRVVNPFIPEGMATLSGMLNGTMKITGDMAAPVFDGYINFDSTNVKVAMLGTEFRFSDEKIPVDSNLVSFKDFNIWGCNSNPLAINGEVNLRSLSDMSLALDASARNIQVVGSDRPRGAEVYGKAFLDIDASVKGNMRYMGVKADVSLLEGTNVTYVLTDAGTGITQQSDDDMVKFVEFADTAQVAAADSVVQTAMAMNVSADLHINQGSVVNVDLNTSGSNKVQVLSAGDLDFSMSPLNGMRLTGRLNINGGFVRYSQPPILTEKNFQFQEGSYVAFNGDVMNPVLNIRAVDVLRANVTQSGQNSRLVNFNVSVAVTNTLENMNVAFDVSTDDDITVQNELSSMSAEQRASQAMNLLLYGQYSGSGTKGNTNLSGNPLFSFLTSQLNSWAASNIKGVDISFGIDQYDRTYEGSTSTTTSYSYRVSKSLFDDRFKIVVGGNYSTDANADENFSQNLINDISFEYMLNRSGTMYVRIFRHTGYESILEGEITQTGVGFVLKRKLNSLWELIGIKRD